MSSRREVLIRILALLQRKTLIKPKKSHIKMLKTALFDCAINEKCCSVDGGRGICPLFSSPPRGIWQLKSPHPRKFAIQGKKNANARGSARGGPGRRWNWLMHYGEGPKQNLSDSTSHKYFLVIFCIDSMQKITMASLWKAGHFFKFQPSLPSILTDDRKRF